MNFDNNYSDGFLGGMVASGLREQKLHDENRRVFEKVVGERDEALKLISQLRAEIDTLKVERNEALLDFQKRWASNHIKNCVLAGFKYALSEITKMITRGDAGQFAAGSGIARSSAPADELTFSEALAWKKAISELQWVLEEMTEAERVVFWEHVHLVFAFTFIPCTSPDAAQITDDFAELINWTRPDLGHSSEIEQG